jgi:hypothetical protein
VSYYGAREIHARPGLRIPVFSPMAIDSLVYRHAKATTRSSRTSSTNEVDKRTTTPPSHADTRTTSAVVSPTTSTTGIAEDTLSCTAVPSLVGSSASAVPTPATSQGNGLRFAPYYLNEIASPSGAPFFSADHQHWIRRCTGQNDVFSNLLGLDPSSSTCGGGDYPADFDLELPARHIVDDYLQMFRATPFRLVFPIVDGVLFQETISQA